MDRRNTGILKRTRLRHSTTGDLGLAAGMLEAFNDVTVR